MRALAAIAIALSLSGLVMRAQAPRPSPPPREATVPFAVGETLTYDVSYSNLLTAGTAVTRVGEKRASFGGTAYAITADGKPVPLIQRLYPVYYKMDTLLDSVALLPQWTGLYTEENGKKRQTSMRFDRPARQVHYEMTTPTPVKADVAVPAGAQDGLALLYTLRTRQFRSGERFTVPVADDGSVYSVNVATSGPERIAGRLGQSECWNLQITIVDDKGAAVGKNIGVWLSTDPKHLPVKIQADLPVGSFVLLLREAKL